MVNEIQNSEEKIKQKNFLSLLVKKRVIFMLNLFNLIFIFYGFGFVNWVLRKNFIVHSGFLSLFVV